MGFESIQVSCANLGIALPPVSYADENQIIALLVKYALGAVNQDSVSSYTLNRLTEISVDLLVVASPEHMLNEESLNSIDPDLPKVLEYLADILVADHHIMADARIVIDKYTQNWQPLRRLWLEQSLGLDIPARYIPIFKKTCRSIVHSPVDEGVLANAAAADDIAVVMAEDGIITYPMVAKKVTERVAAHTAKLNVLEGTLFGTMMVCLCCVGGLVLFSAVFGVGVLFAAAPISTAGLVSGMASSKVGKEINKIRKAAGAAIWCQTMNEYIAERIVVHEEYDDLAASLASRPGQEGLAVELAVLAPERFAHLIADKSQQGRRAPQVRDYSVRSGHIGLGRPVRRLLTLPPHVQQGQKTRKL